VAEPLLVGNCSGFYGDRLGAMREMLEGGPLDVLTGDYLAELTMLILGRDTLKDPSLGYARTFVTQVEQSLGLAIERGVRIVSNAGGLNPAGLAERLREVARGLGLDPVIAHLEGDDLRDRAEELGFTGALTANAYLGAAGIAEALRAGADVVVTGRVTDASLVVGPAIAHHGWAPTAYDALAGATVAGHVIECGTQATGGNFSGFLSLPRDGRPLGFPIAEIAADGSCVITKHPDTGGAVTVDTVTAQLLYEIQGERYLGPDVTTRLDSIRLEQQAPDRVAVTGVTGEAPPERLKVCINELGGFRNQMEFVLTGLDIDAKAAWVQAQLGPALTAASVTWTRTDTGRPGADTEEAASCLLRCSVTDPSPDPVGKAFTGPAIELALGSYPGFTMTSPPAPATPYGVYRPAYVDRSVVRPTVVMPDGGRRSITDSGPSGAAASSAPPVASPTPAAAGATTAASLGTFLHARSGDKGGDANLGLWVTHDDPARWDARVAWLLGWVTAERVRALVPEAADLDIDVVALPNLGGVNVVLHGLLGLGVAASNRFDPQAKGLGEWVRSRVVDIPEELV
jgi:hypothetical protein